MATIVYDVNSGKPLVIGYVEETGVNQVRFDNFEPIRTDTTISLSIEGIGLLPVVNSTIDVTYTMTIAEGKTEAFLVEKNSANTIIRKSPPFMIVVKHNGRIAQFAKSLSMTIRDWFGTVVEELKRRITIVEGGLASEITRATNAEGVLTTNLAQETVRAVAAEEDLDTAISDEVTRAETAEATKIPLPTTAPTAADKILKVNTVNPLTTKWADETIFEETFFWVEPGTTTYAQITTAISNNKMPVMIYAPQNSGNAIFFTYAGKDTQDYHTFSSVSDVKYYEAKIRPDNQWQYGVTNLEKSVYKTNDVETYKTDTTHYPSTKGVADYVTTNLSTKLDKSKLRDYGINSITWTTTRSEITVTTVEDPYKAQRPTGTNTRYWGEFEGCPYFKNRNTYKVTFNGTVYDNICCDYGILVNDGSAGPHPSSTETTVGGCWQLIGNKYYYDSRYENTGEPFCILYIEHGGVNTDSSYYYGYQVGHGILLTSSASTNTLKIETATITQDELPKSLFNNYGYGDRTYQNIGSSSYPRTSLGQGNIVGRGSFAVGESNIVTGQFAVSLGDTNTTSGFIATSTGKNNIASGDYSFVEGQANVASGTYSHAEGQANIASGQDSHVEGQHNVASGTDAHVEGQNNQASGLSSHAEGLYNTVTLDGGHAEGTSNNVLGKYSHAESSTNTITNRDCHAEGQANFAKGRVAHVEGSGNYANGVLQHVQGVNNIPDNETGKTVSIAIKNKDEQITSTVTRTLGKYAHIVGNGNSDTARSNAHTLDWSGNAEFAGDVVANGCGGASPISLSSLDTAVTALDKYFYCTYGTTTYNEIVTALDAGKIPVCVYNQGSYTGGVYNFFGMTSSACYFTKSYNTTNYYILVNTSNTWSNSSTGIEAPYQFKYNNRRTVGANQLGRTLICAEDKDGRITPMVLGNTTAATKTACTVPFRPQSIYYFNSTSQLDAGATIAAATLFESIYTSSCTYTFNGSMPAYSTAYLIGTYNKTTGLFTLDSTSTTSYYVFVPNNTASITLSSYFTTGKYYIRIGSSTATANQLQIEMHKPMYYFDGTNLVDGYTAGGVTDVQINGTSITSGGVANIPMASTNTRGTVLLGNLTYTGITTDATYGSLKTAPASTSDIAARTNEYKPIVPKTIVTAVDSVLCSTSASEALTSQQKANAKARLGISDSEKFELIEEVSIVSGITEIDKYTEPDGTAYNFKAVRIYLNGVTPDSTEYNRIMYMRLFNGDNDIIGGAYHDTWNSRPHGILDVYDKHGFWESELHTNSSATAWNSTYALPTLNMRMMEVNNNYIKHINFKAATDGSSFASGTIKIYAIRA